MLVATSKNQFILEIMTALHFKGINSISHTQQNLGSRPLIHIPDKLKEEIRGPTQRGLGPPHKQLILPCRSYLTQILGIFNILPSLRTASIKMPALQMPYIFATRERRFHHLLPNLSTWRST